MMLEQFREAYSEYMSQAGHHDIISRIILRRKKEAFPPNEAGRLVIRG